MATTVTGFFGNEAIDLNNAATESTLRELVNAIQGNSGQIKNLASKSGVQGAGDSGENLKANNRTVSENTGVFRNLSTFGKSAAESFYKLDDNISPLIGQLIKGNASITVLTDKIGTLNPLLGVAADLFGRLVRFQEENFQAYRTMTDAGVNFSGSLTSLRMAAANSYLTLEQFSGLIAKNSDAFSRMGGTANDGAIAFANASNQLLKGSVGSNLLALGYTTDQVNNGLVQYIAMTGGRTSQEMKNTKDLTAGAASYLTELDSLAEITGKSRQAQEDELKQLQANQAFQSYMQTLDENGRAKANAALLEANAKGGKGAAEALQAQLMGLPPMTKAAQEFTAVAPRMAEANNKMAAAVKDGTQGLASIKSAGNEFGVAARDTADDLGQGMDAIIMGGGELSGTMAAIKGTSNQMVSQGIKTVADAEKQRQSVEARQKEREASQAASMADAEKAMKNLSQAVLGLITPIVDILTPVIGGLAAAISGVANMFSTLPKIVTYGLFGALAGAGAYTAYSKYKKNKDFVASGGTGKKGLLGSITGAVLTRDGSSPDRALYVIIAGGGGTGSVIDDLISGDKSNGKKETPAEREARGKQKLEGIRGARYARYAGTALKGLAGVGTVLAGISAVGDLSDIEKQLSSGEINKNQARTKEAGLVGELAAGAAGGWAGASAGAALGTLLLPGIGTLVGGAIGGLVGGGAGGGLGKYLGEKFGNSLGDSNKANLEEKNKLPEAGQSTDEQIIEHLKKLAEQTEQSNKLHKRAVQHLDDINSNTDNSGPPSF
jgi:hypothetical protein